MWNTYHSFAKVEEAVRLSLKNLDLSYLDLCLIHWPMGYQVNSLFDNQKSSMPSTTSWFLQENTETFPKDADGKFIYSDVDYLETWKALEHCANLGLTKSIGVSNFNSQQLKRILDNATIKPVVNQVRNEASVCSNNF